MKIAREANEIGILLVEDNPADVRFTREMLGECAKPSFKITSAELLKDALGILSKTRPDIVLLDVNLPDSKGLDGLREISDQHPLVPVIVLTGLDDEKFGIEAIQNRAMDYLVKGKIDADLLVRAIRYAIERKKMVVALKEAKDQLEIRVDERTRELKTALSEIKAMKDRFEAENIYFRQESRKGRQFENILGRSDGLKYVLYRAEQVASADTTVLILGETGTGKELVAGAIHDMSPRRERPLIIVNCAALPATLIESELFGREKGAFTGADTRQVGRFELADGSTLCLDEIGELPLDLQAKLLRVIQHGKFERLGSSQTIKVNVRIVATTNRNLEDEVKKGRFRQDLYYRLNVFPITIPPLRQRREDIPIMAREFTGRFSKKMGKNITIIPEETIKILEDYNWPGNIRELESVIERAVIVSPGPVLQLADRLETSSPGSLPTSGTLEEMERRQIIKTLNETRWRINGKNGAAEILGLNPSTLRARMHKLLIVRPDLKSED